MILNLLFRQAQSPSPGGFGGVFLLQMVGIIAIFYFFFIRPQRKREKAHQERLTRLKKGDEVVTAGGIVGKIVHISDDHIVLKSDEARLLVVRSRITEILGEKKEAEGAATGGGARA